MRFQWRGGIDRTEAMLRVTGVALAGGSVAFAAHMLGKADRDPQFVGLEHLAIYARPTSSAPSRYPPLGSAEIDYTPVGSTRRNLPETVLGDFELIKASATAATIRTPQGRIARVSPGVKLPGVGEVVSIRRRDNKWVVVTQGGLICER